MDAHEIYKKETGLEAYIKTPVIVPTNGYMNWLEDLAKTRYEPTILRWIKKMLYHAENKEWFETYWSFDIHGTISKPDYRRDEKKLMYYPYAKETLKIMSDREDIKMILFTSSFPEEIEIYKEQFKIDGIFFDHVNENPEISSAKGSFGYYELKHYFNVLFDDKAGFNPERDWKFLFDYFSNSNYKPNPEWSMKYKEKYHK